jgi:cytochrome c-type biogenesis protein CcmH
MTLWLLLATLTVASIGLLVWPLMRRRGPAADRADYDIEVYKDQLAEVERDRARGVLAESEAEAARTEIARRMLSADAGREGAEAGRSDGAPPWAVAVALAVAVPLAALAIYLSLGAPGEPDRPLAGREAERQQAMGGVPSDMAERAEELAARARENPGDLEAWAFLARSYFVLERYEEAAAAYRHVLAQAEPTPDLLSALGESIVLARDGMVTEEAAAIFERVLALRPGEAGARYYLGLAEVQAGRFREGLELWSALERDTPAGAPWLPSLRASIRALADDLGVDPETVLTVREETAAPALGPGREEVEAAAEMSEDERQEMIRAMVARLSARLEEDPDDVEGWMMLGRSHTVLGDLDAAAGAYARAADLAPSDIDVLTAQAETLFTLADRDRAMPAELLPLMRRMIEVDPDNETALWVLGAAEAASGNKEAARALWTRLRDRLPEGSEQRTELDRQIEALDVGE